MLITVSSPHQDVSERDVDAIQRDLEKIDRRLKDVDQVYLEVRLNDPAGATVRKVTMELEYGPNRLIANAEDPDVHRAVRVARDQLIRQIGDRGRGSHSDHAKR